MGKLTFLIIFNIAKRDPSNLVAHEAAFGRALDADVPALKDVLNDLSLHPIIRHEVFLFTFRSPLFANIYISHEDCDYVIKFRLLKLLALLVY